MCDNFGSGADNAAAAAQVNESVGEVCQSYASIEEIVMVEELEQEYAGLKDKVRELREYL